ncbi:hypothetical protein CHISP_1893 [Chitinispirillum alkaliphilum]|nr:hypothetical protein CHISP_1893 [Chitinispirillum alkaliphilum]
MDYEKFTDRVKRELKLKTAQEAKLAVEATLSTLGERLNGADVHALGAQLPGELKGYLSERSNVEGFNLEEYYNRVASRTGLSYSAGVNQARVVASVLRDAITRGTLEKILEHLPGEYRELFGREPRSPLSPTAPEMG